eukprot:75199_1
MSTQPKVSEKESDTSEKNIEPVPDTSEKKIQPDSEKKIQPDPDTSDPDTSETNIQPALDTSEKSRELGSDTSEKNMTNIQPALDTSEKSIEPGPDTSEKNTQPGPDTSEKNTQPCPDTSEKNTQPGPDTSEKNIQPGPDPTGKNTESGRDTTDTDLIKERSKSASRIAVPSDPKKSLENAENSCKNVQSDGGKTPEPRTDNVNSDDSKSGCCCRDSKATSAPSEGAGDLIPILALINPKSGGGKGKIVMDKVEALSNCKVINILDFAVADTSEPDTHLSTWLKENPEARILVGGGDGTVTWTLQILDRIGFRIPLAILPLGTANEVSGCIGWKRSHTGKKMAKVVSRMRSGQLSCIDLWQVRYEDDLIDEKTEERDRVETPERRPATMIAFFSLGIDANICHKFHNHRESRDTQPSIMQSKMSYLRFGFKEVLTQYEKISKIIHLEVDGKEVKHPERSYRSLQVYNINSMADGVDFWGTAGCTPEDVMVECQDPKLNDQILEIGAIKSVYHLNWPRANIGHALRMAQGSEIRIRLDHAVPVEVDGEPFMNPKGTIHISSLGQRPIILGRHVTSSVRRGVLMDVQEAEKLNDNNN